jgi:hypothetical protein
MKISVGNKQVLQMDKKTKYVTKKNSSNDHHWNEMNPLEIK